MTLEETHKKNTMSWHGIWYIYWDIDTTLLSKSTIKEIIMKYKMQVKNYNKIYEWF